MAITRCATIVESTGLDPMGPYLREKKTNRLYSSEP